MNPTEEKSGGMFQLVNAVCVSRIFAVKFNRVSLSVGGEDVWSLKSRELGLLLDI